MVEDSNYTTLKDLNDPNLHVLLHSKKVQLARFDSCIDRPVVNIHMDWCAAESLTRFLHRTPLKLVNEWTCNELISPSQVGD